MADVGRLLGTKMAVNEYVAFLELQALQEQGLSERSRVVASYALCGFSNFSSIAIQIGGLGTIEGPILGVILFFLLRDLAADWGSWYLIGLGALAISVMLIDRRGVWGALKARGAPSIFVTHRALPPGP